MDKLVTQLASFPGPLFSIPSSTAFIILKSCWNKLRHFPGGCQLCSLTPMCENTPCSFGKIVRHIPCYVSTLTIGVFQNHMPSIKILSQHLPTIVSTLWLKTDLQISVLYTMFHSLDMQASSLKLSYIFRWRLGPDWLLKFWVCRSQKLTIVGRCWDKILMEDMWFWKTPIVRVLT